MDRGRPAAVPAARPRRPHPLDAAELDEWLDAQRRERRPGVHL